jgi:hypothetical protein
MVDFKLLLKVKDLEISCSFPACGNNARYRIQDIHGSANMCEDCYTDLFPRATSSTREDAELEMKSHKYRQLKHAKELMERVSSAKVENKSQKEESED